MMRAIFYPEKKDLRKDKIPGAIWFTEMGTCEAGAMWFYCPCGCGQLNRIEVGREHKPLIAAHSWNWNGSTDAATLSPSVHITNHWHGWLRDGYWEAVGG